MPSVHIENRYCSDDYVAGAAVTFDGDPVTAKSPRTLFNGNVEIATDKLTDGKHVLRITPAFTSDLPVGPRLGENLPSGTTRMFRSLEVDIEVKKGRITTLSVPAGRQEDGTVGAGLNPVRVNLQPIFFKAGDLGPRKHDDISLIVVHQTAGANGQTTGKVHGTLSHFKAGNGSANYLITAEAKPRVIKIIPDNRISGHAGRTHQQTSWGGKSFVDSFSIGIENSHLKETGWPRAQIDQLIRFLEQLLDAYPTIPRNGIVGHSDVLLIGRDCPGREFDWELLEQKGLGMIPRKGSVSLDFAYGGFFRLRPNGQLQGNDRDNTSKWGGESWVDTRATATAAGRTAGRVGKVVGHKLGTFVQDVVEGAVGIATTVIGHPIEELQRDLNAIGYQVDVTGVFDVPTVFAVQVFQKHFFSAARRALLVDKAFGNVDRVTAEFIKAVRPV